MEFITSLPPPVTGGLIVGIFALTGVFLTFLGQHLLNWWHHRKMIKGVLQAIYEELKQTNDLLFDGPYVQKFMQEIEEEPEKVFRLNFPISRDYLTIYRSNANLIGQINDPPDLRPKIVRTYVHLQMLIELYKANNIKQTTRCLVSII